MRAARSATATKESAPYNRGRSLSSLQVIQHLCTEAIAGFQMSTNVGLFLKEARSTSLPSNPAAAMSVGSTYLHGR